jgi:hypothetical protein
MADAMVARVRAAVRAAPPTSSARAPRRVASFLGKQLSGLALRPLSLQPQLATTASRQRRGARRVLARRYARAALEGACRFGSAVAARA